MALVPGEPLSVPEGVEAILELPASRDGPAAEVTAGPESEVEFSSPPSDGESAVGDREERPGRLDLRVGRVRITVVKEGFAVRTPTAQATGRRGAVFRVRVVLDGTTTVAVERGSVTVESLRGRGDPLVLTEGGRARFDARGGREVDAERPP